MKLEKETTPYVLVGSGKLHLVYCGVGQRSDCVERVTVPELLTMLNNGYQDVPMCCGASPRTWVSVRWPKLFPWGWR